MRPQATDMDIKTWASALLLFCGSVALLIPPLSAYASGTCPDTPSGGGQTMSASAKTQTTNCPVTNGMYVRSFTTLRLDAIATANGQCQITGLQCTGASCVCVPTQYIQERTINNIHMWVDITNQSQNGTYTIGRVYGKNANGTTGFFHVLDTTQPDSSGPLYLGVSSAGEYRLHFQGLINTTACNIQPNVTPQVDIMVHARTTLHRGQVNNGKLDGCGVTMTPLDGTGYTYYPGTTKTRGDDTYGSPEWAHRTIKEVGSSWYALHPNGPRLQFGDISQRCGGPWDEHPGGTHQNGLNIDMRYVKNTAPPNHEGPLDLATQSSIYSKSLTVELLNLFASTGRIQTMTISPGSNITPSDVPNVPLVTDNSGTHDNHIHLQLFDEDGPDSNNCAQQP